MLYFAKWKISLIVGVCLLGLVFLSPNFLPARTAADLPDWLPNQQISLGLDLQGGSHLLLEVDVDALVKERIEALVDATRTALRGERIRYRFGARGPRSLEVRLLREEQREQGLELIRGLANPITTGVLGVGGPADDIDVASAADGTVTVTLTDEAIQEARNSAVEQSIEIVRRRIDETGVREPTIQRQGPDRILVQLPGIDDPERIKRLLGRTAKMVFRLVDVSTSVAEARRGSIPAGSNLLDSADEVDGAGNPLQYVVRKRVMVSGERLVDAQPSFDESGRPSVTFRFDSAGAKRFGETTQANVNRPFAIVLDGKVVSAPVIREPILGGSGQITGRFSVAEAQDLAVVLRAGALPAPLKILEERTVGPDLGADSVRAGKIAGVVAFIAVMVFMFLSYGVFGLAANVALVVNMVLIGAVLSVLQASLTLPGIAGIVLTIGMAVDANVLVFERIREEVRTGKTPLNALEAGYRRALTTIIDANVTTLIAAILLFQFGSGPVRGFAVTLAIGIVSSVFTAITLARFLIVLWMRRTRPATLAV